MGTCYSKNASESHSPSPGKLPSQKRKDSKRSNKNSGNISPETKPLNENEIHVQKFDGLTTNELKNDISQHVKNNALNSRESRSSTPDYIPDLLDAKFVDEGVAPSDSGIESIITLHDETHESVQLRSGNDSLSKKLERLSRGSCHKCGHFKLVDSALTALLADTYCSCGPRLAGKSSVNPQCQTHGVNRNKRTVSPVQYVKYDSSIGSGRTGANFTTESSGNGQSGSADGNLDKSDLKSSLKNSNSTKKDKSLRISLRSADSLGLAVTMLSSARNSKSDVLGENKDSAKAPLAHFDSVDTILNDSPTEKNKKRRSLLSEILDITDSICKCDFYSNEYCWITDQQGTDNDVSEARYYTGDLRFSTDSPHKSHETDDQSKPVSGETMHNSLHQHHNSLDKPCVNPILNESQRTDSVAQDCNSPSKKCASLPKNVSFATHGCDSQMVYIGPSSLQGHRTTEGYDYNLSDASSGVFTNNSASETFLVNNCKDLPKRCASLGSGVVLSDSSSEAVDGGTNEDLTSLDLDSVSRVTSLSYGSIRQLMESTEDLVSPFESAKRMIVDGVDCMIIPTDIYRQMQTDIATLKQQLLCLSTLIQQEAEELERNCASEADGSFIFQS